MSNFFHAYRALVGRIAAAAVLWAAPGLVLADGANDAILQNPLGDITSFPQLLSALLDAALVVGIPVAVLFIVWAGFRFVVAQGKPEKIKDAQKNFLWTIVGIGIFIGASIIIKIIVHTLANVGVNGLDKFL